MRRGHRLLVGSGIGAIVLMQLIFSALLLRPDGIRVRYPAPGERVPLSSTIAGNAWMRGGIDRVEVRVSDASGNTVATVAAQRDAVKYKGKPVTLLAAWRAAVQFPGPGAWQVGAVVTGGDGRRLEAPARRVTADPSQRSRAFQFGSVFHVIPIAVVVLLSVLVPVLVRRAVRGPLGERARDRAALVITLVLWVDEIAYQTWWFLRGAWSLTNSLMLHMCGLAIVFLPVLYFTRSEKWRQYLFEILFFFGLGGAVQALFAPDIGLQGFPEPKYFCFFISHGTIVIGTVFAAALYKVDLTWRSWIRVVVVTNLCTWAAFGINHLLKFLPPYEVGNYFIINYPPPDGSVVDIFADIFGPAPRYIAGLELMGLAVFAILYLPFPIRRALRKRRAARQAG